MIIVNADDWGRSRSDTDAALACYKEERITSVSAMVFMEDSARAAELAKEMGIDVGLHINLTQPFLRGGALKSLAGLPRSRRRFPDLAQVRVLDLSTRRSESSFVTSIKRKWTSSFASMAKRRRISMGITTSTSARTC